MKEIRKAQTSGSSATIAIPAYMARELQIGKGDRVEISLEYQLGKRVVIVKKVDDAAADYPIEG